jgi:16S rRNA (guanine527-N7)-methyltransferase
MDRLAEHRGEAGLMLEAHQLDQLIAYLSLIEKWNAVYNLTAVRDPERALVQHLLDSLAAIGPMQRQLGPRSASGRPRVLDAGSGAGLPGVVIAIACPGVDMFCVDAAAKKASFVRQVAGELKLSNLHVRHARVEALNTDAEGRFDLVTSRAFASLAAFVALTRTACAPEGVWMAMKGKIPADEIAELRSDIDVFHVERLDVPMLDAERCLIWMRSRTPSNAS